MAGASKFTPGPWRVDNGDVVGANNVMLGSAADLNLIAAALDLYEASEDAESTYDALLATIHLLQEMGWGEPKLNSMRMLIEASQARARAALSKAEGASQ